MVLIVLAGFCFGLYNLAVSNNITPWRWVARYVGTFMLSFLAITFITTMVIVFSSVDPNNLIKDKDFIKRVNETAASMIPFVFLYEFGLFFFFRQRILKYVRGLDEADRIASMPTPSKPEKEDKDLSYFR